MPSNKPDWCQGNCVNDPSSNKKHITCAPCQAAAVMAHAALRIAGDLCNEISAKRERWVALGVDPWSEPFIRLEVQANAYYEVYDRLTLDLPMWTGKE